MRYNGFFGLTGGGAEDFRRGALCEFTTDTVEDYPTTCPGPKDLAGPHRLRSLFKLSGIYLKNQLLRTL